MGRNIRADTVERIRVAHEEAPHAFGPMLGEMAMHFGIPTSIVATITKAHEQTVLRWFFGQSKMHPQWIKASLRLFGVLTWMRANDIEPLTGDTTEKMTELTGHLREFESLANHVA